MSGTSYSLSTSLIRSPEGSRARAFRVLPGGGQRHVGIQGREQPAARPGSLPPQREHGGVTAGHHVQEMHLDRLGHARRGTQRADPDQAGEAITVGSL